MVEVLAREPADGVTGRLLRGGDRDHLRLPVLRRGLRRELQRHRRSVDRRATELAALLLGAPVPTGVRLLQDGLRLGDGMGVARHLPVLYGRDPPRVTTVGALPGGCVHAMSYPGGPPVQRPLDWKVGVVMAPGTIH